MKDIFFSNKEYDALIVDGSQSVKDASLKPRRGSTFSFPDCTPANSSDESTLVGIVPDTSWRRKSLVASTKSIEARFHDPRRLDAFIQAAHRSIEGVQGNRVLVSVPQDDVVKACRAIRHCGGVVVKTVAKAEAIEEDVEKISASDIKPGDLVDFGSYGKLYVLKRIDGNRLWVTDEKRDRNNPNADGWYIDAGLARRVKRGS